MSTDEHMSFLGVPVKGTITRPGSERTNQRPIEELQPLLAAFLADENLVEVGWTQYTPYFNDGEPCVFSVGEPWVRTVRDDDDQDRWQLEMYSHPTLSLDNLSPELEESAQRANALCAAIEGGQFVNVLLDAFGDHAEVRVRKDGISVEFYRHD